MEFSDLKFDAKYLNLLPRKHRLTDLFIENAHRLSLNYGLEQTVNFIHMQS